METTCSMVGCYNTINNDLGAHFYPFPKDFDQCMLWVQNCGRAELFEDFAYGGAQPFVNRVICSEHFNNSSFNDSSCLSDGLKPEAVPILNYEEPQLVLVKEEYEDNSISDTDEFIPENIKQESLDTDTVNDSTNKFNEPEHVDFEQDRLSEEEPYLPLLVLSKEKLIFDPQTNFSGKSQKAFRIAWKRALESSEQREARNRANALRNAFRRANETEEERKSRNEANALRNACRRASETEEQRKDRLYKNAVRAAVRRSMESEDEQMERRRKNALRAACRRSSETEDQRAARRLKDKIRSAERRKKETELQSKLRKYNDAVRAAFRRSNESDEQRQQRRLYDVVRAARRRSNETDEQRQKRLQADRERAGKRRLLKKVHQSVTDLQNTFLDHDLGPYVDYDISNSSSKTNGSQGQCTSDLEQCANDRLKYNLDENSSNKSLNDSSEYDSFENTKVGEVSNNNSVNDNEISQNVDVPSFSNNQTYISSNDQIESQLVLSNQSVNADMPKFVWCT